MIDLLPEEQPKQFETSLSFEEQKIIERTIFLELNAFRFKGKIPDPKSNTITSSATPAINTDATDMFTITALATAITSFTTYLAGNPNSGRKLIIRIKDDGTARAITWGAKFASRGATLPTTTVLGKYVYVGLIYNETTATWDCVAVANES